MDKALVSEFDLSGKVAVVTGVGPGGIARRNELFGCYERLPVGDRRFHKRPGDKGIGNKESRVVVAYGKEKVLELLEVFMWQKTIAITFISAHLATAFTQDQLSARK